MATDSSCEGMHGVAYAWECAEREHLMANHITTDAFFAHRLYDETETGGTTEVPVHGWMHSRAACQADRTAFNCYNWHDDDYRELVKARKELGGAPPDWPDANFASVKFLEH